MLPAAEAKEAPPAMASAKERMANHDALCTILCAAAGIWVGAVSCASALGSGAVEATGADEATQDDPADELPGE